MFDPDHDAYLADLHAHPEDENECAEIAVLVDVMNVDIPAARARLAEFVSNELGEFEAQVDTLADVIAAEIRRRAVRE